MARFALFLVGLGAAREWKGYRFEEFLKEFSKDYSANATEFAFRKQLFEQRLNEVLIHNADATQTWKKGINHFSDLTQAERRVFLGYKKIPMLRSSPLPDFSSFVVPNDIDWRTKGVVTPVKDQGGCGSCWAFAATETIESHVAIATGKLLKLSPQNMVSCTPNPHHCGGTGGCDGATAELGFQYVADKGISDEATEPYRGVTGKCQEKTKAAKVTGFVKLPENKQDPLVAAVSNIGPIAISVAADPWFSYASGVFSGCSKNAVIDHGVQLVGYTDAYWIVRNSWGASWGEKGYIRLKKTANETDWCGVDNDPSAGSGCDGGPSKVDVCGMCGILYDTAYPTGASLA